MSLPGPVDDVDDVETWAHWVRERVTPNLDDGVVRGPDWVISALDEVSALAGRMALVVWKADRLRGDARRTLARAQAVAQSRTGGATVAERAADVVKATTEEQAAADVADAAFGYARTVAGLVESRKSSVQTIARMVETTYQLAGSRR